MREFGGAFLRSGKENSPVQIQKKGIVFSAPEKKNAKDCDVNMHTDRLLKLFREKLSAPSVHGGARCVSGPALVRTAPALPTPWNPNFHAPSSCPSLTVDPANHEVSAASTSAPSPDIIGRGIPPIGWRETRGPITPPHVLCVHQC